METAISILSCFMWCCFALLCLLLVLLHMPYRLRIGALWGENRLRAQLWLGWPLRSLGLMLTASLERQQAALLLLGFPVFKISVADWKKNRKKKARKGKKKSKKGDRMGPLQLFRMPYKAHILREIRRALDLNASLTGRFGFDDPSTTAQLALLLVLIQSAFPDFGRQIELDYVDPACEGEFDGSLLIWLPRIYVVAILFILSREGRAVLGHRRKTSTA